MLPLFWSSAELSARSFRLSRVNPGCRTGVAASNSSASLVGGKGGQGVGHAGNRRQDVTFVAALSAQVCSKHAGELRLSRRSRSSLPPSQHDTDYDALARMKAGSAAYNHIGEHHGPIAS